MPVLYHVLYAVLALSGLKLTEGECFKPHILSPCAFCRRQGRGASRGPAASDLRRGAAAYGDASLPLAEARIKETALLGGLVWLFCLKKIWGGAPSTMAPRSVNQSLRKPR